MHDAIVVGGGIVGSAVAYHLARAGADAMLVDRHHEGRATDAGAGIVAPATSSRTDSDTWFRLAVDAFDYYPALADRLAREQDGDVGFSQPGLLAVAPETERAAFEAALARIADRQREYGHPDPGSVEEVSPEHATELFPPLSSPDRALHLHDAGRVDGATFANALRRAAGTHGLDTLDATVESVRVDGGAVSGVLADGERIEGSAVVVAGGAWSGEFADDLGVHVPVAPQRGQILHLDTHADTREWPVVTVFGGEYLVPWPDGTVAAGATREDDAGFDARVTAGGVHEVLDATLDIAPGLGDADLAAAKAGLRPTSPDGLPILGPVPSVDGAYLATGHGPTGLQLGPYSGRLVAQQVLGDQPDTDVSHLSVERFGD